MEHGQARERLVAAAAVLLERDGPEALQARRVSAEVGASTMAVYTHFGGMPQLVEALALAGFGWLSERLEAVPREEEPLTRFVRLGVVYRGFARENPQLYRLMFGIAAPGGYRLPVQDLTEAGTPAAHVQGSTAFGFLIDGVERLVEVGFIRGEPGDVAAQVWTVMHGYVLLEISGVFGEHGVERVLLPLVRNLMTGLGGAGDAVEAVAREVRGSSTGP